MRGRTALGILLGVLLPLPWVLVVIAPHLGQQADDGPRANLSPVLSLEERRQRVTYHRPCETSAECEPPRGCLDHWRLKTSRCTDSECVPGRPFLPGARDRGWCGRPCQGRSPGRCAEGFVCAEDLPEPACLPTCEAGGPARRCGPLVPGAPSACLPDL